MESSLTNACKIRIQNFEGPFDLLFHLIEKNQINLYDIPINEITDQYMEYLFAMQKLDLEVASEFLVMAATLLHIKSKMLLPEKKEKKDDGEEDPRGELVSRLVKYKKYKEFSCFLRERELEWENVFYKLPEVVEADWEGPILELSAEELKRVYIGILERNRKKMNRNVGRIAQIIEREKVSLKSKMREVVRILINKAFFKFSELFSIKRSSKTEVVTGFMAILELAKLRKVRLEQSRQFSDIFVYRANYGDKREEDEKGETAVEN